MQKCRLALSTLVGLALLAWLVFIICLMGYSSVAMFLREAPKWDWEPMLKFLLVVGIVALVCLVSFIVYLFDEEHQNPDGTYKDGPNYPRTKKGKP